MPLVLVQFDAIDISAGHLVAKANFGGLPRADCRDFDYTSFTPLDGVGFVLNRLFLGGRIKRVEGLGPVFDGQRRAIPRAETG